MTSTFDHPSPTPYLPRIRSVEIHDLPFTPYTLNFMTTRVLQFGWTTDYAEMLPFIKPLILKNIMNKNLYELRFGEKNGNNNNKSKNTSLCFADSIGELLSEVYEQVQKQKKQKNNTMNQNDNHNNTFRILDMCCGAGGPSFKAAKKLSEILNSSSKTTTKVHLTVSDLVPHPQHWKHHVVNNDDNEKLLIDYQEKSVDATKVEPGVAPNSIWTIYGAFHHFEDEVATKFLKNAADHEECNGVLIVELAEHRLSSAILLAPAGLLLTLLLPFYIFDEKTRSSLPSLSLSQKIEKLVFFIKVLFFLPILMLTIMWDSTISCTRTLTTQEMLQMAKKADPEGKMEWHAAVRDFVPGLGMIAPGIVYLRGVRRKL